MYECNGVETRGAHRTRLEVVQSAPSSNGTVLQTGLNILSINSYIFSNLILVIFSSKTEDIRINVSFDLILNNLY